MDFVMIVFLCAMGFIAAFIDAIAGGSGLITIPAYMIAGLEPHIMLGTNKFAAFSGTAISTATFTKSLTVITLIDVLWDGPLWQALYISPKEKYESPTQY